MNIKKRNILISIILILLSIIFTILIKLIDVQPIGIDGTSIGFATIKLKIYRFN